MMHFKQKQWLTLICVALLFPLPGYSKAEDEIAWNTVLKKHYFGDRKIEESNQVFTMTAPYRAEDPALVPVRIASKIPQTSDQYIKTITMLIDKNPEPFVGSFHFTPKSGRAELAMRVRVNTYSYVRAIAELNDGQLFMKKVFVKASGGCSAPIGADLEDAMKRIGKMKLRMKDEVTRDQPVLAQLMVSHPNITGMQMDQVTRIYRPKHFIEEMKISFNGKPVLTAETDIAISADPNFRFYFVPDKPGMLKAEIKDNKGMHFSKSYQVEF